MRVVQICLDIGGIHTHEPHEKGLNIIVPFVVLVKFPTDTEKNQR